MERKSPFSFITKKYILFSIAEIVLFCTCVRIASHGKSFSLQFITHRILMAHHTLNCCMCVRVIVLPATEEVSPFNSIPTVFYWFIMHLTVVCGCVRACVCMSPATEEVSPFNSIPTAFYWFLTTATTGAYLTIVHSCRACSCRAF